MPRYQLREGVEGKVLPTLGIEFRPGEAHQVPVELTDPDFEEVPAPEPEKKEGKRK